MDNYEVLDLIGKGNFGSISKILRKSDNKILVWKELDYGRMTEKEKQNIVSEVNILRDLHHPNIVRYYDRIIDKKNTKIYIIMEYCEGGDIGLLIKRLKKTNELIPEEIIWKIFTQLVLALFECHNHKDGKILHRDIKPSNVFLDGENNIKLGDFGLSRMLSNESYFAYSHVGTPYYMSPEQIEEVKYNEKSDIWSLGCFLYEVTTFNPPFEATNQLSLALKIKKGKVEPINGKYSEDLKRIIAWMLNVDQNKRPSVEELVNYPPVMTRIRERKLKEHYLKMKKMEEIIKEKEGEITKREEECTRREKEIEEREKKVKEKEDELEEKRKDIEKKEIEVKALMEQIKEMKIDIEKQSLLNNPHTIDQIDPTTLTSSIPTNSISNQSNILNQNMISTPTINIQQQIKSQRSIPPSSNDFGPQSIPKSKPDYINNHKTYIHQQRTMYQPPSEILPPNTPYNNYVHSNTAYNFYVNQPNTLPNQNVPTPTLPVYYPQKQTTIITSKKKEIVPMTSLSSNNLNTISTTYPISTATTATSSSSNSVKNIIQKSITIKKSLKLPNK